MSFLNRAMFNLRKICVVNLKTGAEKNVECWGDLQNESPH